METPVRTSKTSHLANAQQTTPLQIPASPYMKNLGYGTCVNVYKLERSPRQGKMRSPWAVKRVSKRTSAEVDTEVFNKRIEKEASILRKLNHPNIVAIRGVNKDDNVFSLVLECCPLSLGAILEERFENEFGPLESPSTLKMIRDITSALDYLHTKAKILHGDLKSFNILVKGDFELCKLCDFGVSLPLDANGLVDFKNNPELRYVGTNLWSAPEVIDDVDVIDYKADIFSFGLVVYETIALVPPHTISVTNQTDEHPLENTADESLNKTIDESVNKTTDESVNKTTDESVHEAAAETADESLNEAADDESLDYQFEEIDIACGTRPPLPQSFEMSEEYNQIIEIFYTCTANLAEDRPSARAILDAVNAKMK